MQFKQSFTGVGVISGVLWLTSYAVMADTVLLDPATLAVGASVGEFLVVKEGCPNPPETNCQATEKMRYVSALPGQTSKIEFPVDLTDNFELNINIDLAKFTGRAITLLKADSISSLYVRFPGNIEFNDEDRYNDGSTLGWRGGSFINHVKLSANNGIAYLNINGVPFKVNKSGSGGNTVTLDTSQPFVKLVIAGIKEADRLFEITLKGDTGGSIASATGDGDFDSGKQADIQQCVSNPASCGIAVSSSEETCTGGTHATYTPSTGEVHIPFIDVPGPFGDTLTYEVYLTQQPLTFAFNLDTHRIIAK